MNGIIILEQSTFINGPQVMDGPFMLNELDAEKLGKTHGRFW